MVTRIQARIVVRMSTKIIEGVEGVYEENCVLNLRRPGSAISIRNFIDLHRTFPRKLPMKCLLHRKLQRKFRENFLLRAISLTTGGGRLVSGESPNFTKFQASVQNGGIADFYADSLGGITEYRG